MHFEVESANFTIMKLLNIKLLLDYSDKGMVIGDMMSFG